MEAIFSFFVALFISIGGLFGFGGDQARLTPTAPERSAAAPENSPRALLHGNSDYSESERSSAEETNAPGSEVVEFESTSVRIYNDGQYRYIESNGLPNHETGEFPNSGNPNTISEQNISVRVTLNPLHINNQTPARVPGIALNGILMEPGTAEREGNYNIEALQDTYNLGLDDSNAHVQPTGLYHYHGVPEGLLDTLPIDGDLVQVGWAADGFPMYHSLAHVYVPGYTLKSLRSDGSTPDGTFTQDFEFTAAGNLDECNGAWIDEETYAYFVTDEFPYLPRCLNGEPDESFDIKNGPAPAGANQPPQPNSNREAFAPPPRPSNPSGGTNPTPPPAATNACADEDVGAWCMFDAPHGSETGSCQNTPSGMACVPNDAPPVI